MSRVPYHIPTITAAEAYDAGGYERDETMTNATSEQGQEPRVALVQVDTPWGPVFLFGPYSRALPADQISHSFNATMRIVAMADGFPAALVLASAFHALTSAHDNSPAVALAADAVRH